MDDKVIFTLRLPPALHEQLKEYAQKEHRSLHAQILKFLEDGVYAQVVIQAELTRIAELERQLINRQRHRDKTDPEGEENQSC